MSSSLYTELRWLPPKPNEFPAMCKALGTSMSPGSEARALAQFGLATNDLIRLGRNLIRIGPSALAPLQPFKLGVISNALLDLMAPVLTATAARYGIALECVTADFGQTTAEALDAESVINRFRPDAVLMAIDHRGLPLRFVAGSRELHEEGVSASLQVLTTIRQGFQENAGCVCIVQTIPPPPEALFGSLDRSIPGTPRSVLEDLNGAIAKSIDGTPDILFDVASLASTVGLSTWYSPSEWNLAKLQFSEACLPLYADHVLRLIAASRGKSRRCLVLDLDNTLWGGVIGDDGLDGIKIAQGDAVGEAHLEVQQLALDLRSRGVVLAVCSKNTDEIARQPFRAHPEMRLKENHIAVFQANWDDKATNITAIADTLSLGLESVVFLDDNPVERDLVRKELPQVAVPELPDDPAHYARYLAAAGYFEAVRFLDEDRAKADMYKLNAERATIRARSTDMASYLATLDMEIIFSPFDQIGRSRISQLINKSNQFNLTTRRYSEADVAQIERDEHVFALQIRLIDKLGDNGMISVVICRPADEGDWEIDTWLMSCRVLGRGVEVMVLRELLGAAREQGVRRIVGRYIPTERNALVRDHYEKLGFSLLSRDSDGTSVWVLPVDADVTPVPMKVTRQFPAVEASR
ncbi:MAG: HAD-IIIC family phosphatase [Hyphomicrobium sp.]